MVEVFVSRIGRDSASDSNVVVLQEKGGSRLLPIWIGPVETDSIVRHIHKVKDPRPMTHDLVRNLILGLGAELVAVNIPRIEDRTYIAELRLRIGGGMVDVDARPSDCIAIALRLDAPIFVSEDLLVDGEAVEEQEEDPGPDFSAPSPDDVAAQGLTDAQLASEQLKRYLEALRPEDFGKFNP
ncbi:MAG: bifunctional nuclease family protein [Gemmatimonadota bacterium]